MTCSSHLAVVLLLAASAATAGDDEFSRQSLKGLKGVGVLLEDLHADVEQDGLNKTSIQTDVELKLRQAGITVLTQAERRAAPGGPFLYITVNTQQRPTAAGLYAYSISVELSQNVQLERDPTIQIVGATTWSVGEVGTVGRDRLRGVRDGIKDLVDMFINAYLSVNPKG